jgi:4-hydroxybenzoate polyprenyltransferase
VKKYLKLIRVHHYIKNILIFLPLFFSKNLFNKELFFNNFMGFASFCFIASVVYIINDIQDIEKDRLHSKKKYRPIASGQVSIPSAWCIALLTIVLSIVCNYISAKNNIYSWIILALYLFTNYLYSIKLKNVPILDITILVSGFLLRLLYGSVITNIEISKWLFLTVMSISFYLGLGKRRNELKQENSTRKVLESYSPEFLDKNMYICLGLTIVFYALWAVDAQTITRLGTDSLIWTVPLVLIISMKYSLNVEGKSDGDPVDVILQDKVLILMVLVYIITVFSIIYF